MFTKNSQFKSFRSAFMAQRAWPWPLRWGAALIGVALLSVVVLFSLFAGMAMLALGGINKGLTRRNMAKPSVDPRVVEGEYQVVRKSKLPSA